jgi:hypothetical protein
MARFKSDLILRVLMLCDNLELAIATMPLHNAFCSLAFDALLKSSHL